MAGHRKGELNWGDTRVLLPSEAPIQWNNILTGGRLASDNGAGKAQMLMNDLFREFPVAILNSSQD
jgi:(1->4)-alpha-D-glucan 1-alpha-D-glucosylmutase